MRYAVPFDEEPQEPSFDMEATKDRAILILRAPLRHPKIAAAAVVIATALGGAAALFMTPTYESEAVIAVQKSIATPALGNPNQNQQQNADFDPVVGVSELVKGRENLLGLVREAHLTEKVHLPKPNMTEDQKVQFAAKVLEHHLYVKTDGSTVSFTANWDEPQAAYDIVSGAARTFFESRNAAEVAIISDGIQLLEEHAKAQRDSIDEAMTEFMRLKEGWKGGVVAANPGGSSPGSSVVHHAPIAAGPDPEVARRLEDKKQQIRDTQAERSRQLMEAKSQMAGLLATYTPSHPSVISLQRKIDSLTDEPANLTALRNEERALLAQIAEQSGVKAAGGAARGIGGGPAAAAPVARPGMPLSAQDLEVSDPASAMSLSKLQSRIHKYEEFMDQISAAKLELDLAKNSFKYRYNMFRPPELPAKPKHPWHILFPIAGGLVGIVLAFALAAAMDAVSGRFVESWQVRRRLSLPVLGEVIEP